jgi:hypothetical protein
MCTVHTTNNPPFYQLSGQIPTVWVGKPWSEHGSPVIVVGSASDSALAFVHCVSEAALLQYVLVLGLLILSPL